MEGRQEIERLRSLAEWGIAKLSGYGHKSSAETLKRNLEAPSPQKVRKKSE
ncbi:hypothetical protein D9M72_631470 [compost metagenome]